LEVITIFSTNYIRPFGNIYMYAYSTNFERWDESHVDCSIWN